MSGLLTVAPGGEFTGYGSVFNVVDLVGDIVLPGAFVNLPDFRRRGVLLWSHDVARPVAYPLEVRDDGVGLLIRGAFHDTPDGRAARTVLQERMAAGLSYGLSIGYIVLQSNPAPEPGQTLLRKLQLIEVSLVTVPANPAAGVTNVKYDRTGRPNVARRRRVLGQRELEAMDRENRIALAVAHARALGVEV